MGRDERIQHIRQIERREKLRAGAKWTGIGLAALMVVAGAAYGISLLPEKPKTVHWHPTWEVYVNGANVRWASPRFDMRDMGAATHFHQPDDNTIHAEGKTDRLYLGRLLNALGGKVSDNELTLPEGVLPKPGTYSNNETDRLRVFIQPNGEDWREVGSDFKDLTFKDKMRVLVTYGHSTDDEIARQQASVKEAPNNAAAVMTPTTNRS